MKRFKKFLTLFLAFLLVFALASCATLQRDKNDAKNNSTSDEKNDSASGLKNDVDTTTAPKETVRPEGVPLDPVDRKDYSSVETSISSDTPSAAPPTGTEPSGGASQVVRTPGLMTAAAWNENLHYDFWKSLFVSGQGKEDSGKFLNYYRNNNWGFDSTQRVKVTVQAEGSPVRGATVFCYDENQELRFSAKTGADGIAYLFPNIAAGTIEVQSGEFTSKATFDSATCELEVELGGATEKVDVIKIMLVLDATGSMGDEFEYLRNELEDVIKRIAVANNDTRIDLALLFYRDDGDNEKFAYYDFENVTDQKGLNEQLANLKNPKNNADGGGDTPEAVDEALELAMSQAWGDDNATKIIFHVLDASPHSGQQNQERFGNAVRKAASLGIRFCPILCSSFDLQDLELCEYLVRQAAIYTGGTFIFVTDDSGVGDAHLDPKIPDSVVEKLNDLMVRLVNGYHTGTFADPVKWNAGEEEQPQQ